MKLAGGTRELISDTEQGRSQDFISTEAEVNRESEGRAPIGVQGQNSWSGGQGAKPSEAESFSVVGYQRKFSYFTTYSLFSKMS